MRSSILEFVNNSKTFSVNKNKGEHVEKRTLVRDPKKFLPRPATNAAAIESVRNDMSGLEKRFDNRLDTLICQMENLILIIGKSKADNLGTPRRNEVFSYCQETSHYASNCRENQHTNNRCDKCEKLGNH